MKTFWCFKIPNLVELGCSVGEPDDLHRQLILLNRKLLERLKTSIKDAETLANHKSELKARNEELVTEKIELKVKTSDLLADKLKLESRVRDSISEKLELKTQTNDLLGEKLKLESRLRDLGSEKLELKTSASSKRSSCKRSRGRKAQSIEKVKRHLSCCK